jgi:hypothetical protein
MRLRSLALALALSLGSGALFTVHAAGQNKVAKARAKQLKKLAKQRAKLSKAPKYKAPKQKHK